jgi:hypothetical protein
MTRTRRVVRVSDGSLPYPDGSPIPAGVITLQTPGVGNTKFAWWIQIED